MLAIQPQFQDSAIGGYYSLDDDTVACEVLNARGHLKRVVVTNAQRGEYVNNRAYDAILSGDAEELTEGQYLDRKAQIEERRRQASGFHLI